MNLTHRYSLAAALLATALAAPVSLAQSQGNKPVEGKQVRQQVNGVIQKVDSKQQIIVVVPRVGQTIQSQQSTQQGPKRGKDADRGLVILISDKTAIRLLGKGIPDEPVPAPAPDQGGKVKPKPSPDQGSGKDKLSPDQGGKVEPKPSPDQGGGKVEPSPDQGGGKVEPKPSPDQGGGKVKPSPDQGGGKVKPSPDQGGGKVKPSPDQGGGKVEPKPSPDQFNKLRVDQIVRVVYKQQDDGKLEAIRIEIQPEQQNP